MANSPKKETAEAAPEASAAKSGSKKKWVLIALAGVLLVAGAAGGAWFMLKSGPADAGDAPAKTAKKTEKPKDNEPPVFLPLEAFVVNLRAQAPQTGDQFLQTEMTLRLAGPEVVNMVKLHMPEVRNRVLRLLSTKTSQDLLTTEGKDSLAESIRTEITGVIDPASIKPATKPKIEKIKDDETGEAKEEEEAGTVAPQEKVAGKVAEKEADAEAEEPEETTDADDDEDVAIEEHKVKSVLFTSFIIQ